METRSTTLRPSANDALAAGEPARDLRDANDRLIQATLQANELAEAAAQADAIFNALPDVIVRYDRDLNHLYVNTAMERLTGWTQTELLGTTSEALGVASELVACWKDLLLRALAAGEPSEKSFELDAPGGRRAFHARVIPERNAQGSVASVVVIAR